MTKQNHIVVIEHDNNSRSNLIRLRMRHGSAGYGIYHLLLEYLLTEPGHTAETDYNVLGFVFHEDAARVKSVVEDFGLFSLNADGSHFSHEGLTEEQKAKKDVSASRRKAAMQRWGKRAANDTDEKSTAQAEDVDMQKAESAENAETAARREGAKKENQKKQEKTEKNKKGEKKEKNKKKETDVVDDDFARARANDIMPASCHPTTTTMISAAAPSGTAYNDTYLRQFFGHAGTNGSNVQTLLMNLGMRADEFPRLRQMAEGVLAEWRMADKRHTDYGDFTRHLISTLRIRLAHMKQTAATMPICQETADDRERQRQERRREWAERERKAVTYEQYLAMKDKGLIPTGRIAG